ncbi:hypothetical protein EJ110_NYTH42765 [Nymphaea thermarum]|nr:hypothetical protein EJ110_NYTH42765 [Nymphaea thermarum]
MMMQNPTQMMAPSPARLGLSNPHSPSILSTPSSTSTNPTPQPPVPPPSAAVTRSASTAQQKQTFFLPTDSPTKPQVGERARGRRCERASGRAGERKTPLEEKARLVGLRSRERMMRPQEEKARRSEVCRLRARERMMRPREEKARRSEHQHPEKGKTQTLAMAGPKTQQLNPSTNRNPMAIVIEPQWQTTATPRGGKNGGIGTTE